MSEHCLEKAGPQTIHNRLTSFALAENTRKNTRDQISTLLNIFGDADTVPLARVLTELYPDAGAKNAHGNFRAYMRRLNRTLRHAGIQLELASTPGAVPPEERVAWFWDLEPEDAGVRDAVAAAIELTRRTLAAPAGLGSGSPMWEMAQLTAARMPGEDVYVDDSQLAGHGARGAPSLHISRELYAPAAPCASFRVEMEEFYSTYFRRHWAMLPGRAKRFLSGFSAKLEPIRRISPHPEELHEAAGFEVLAFDQAGRSYSNIARCARDFGVPVRMWLLGLMISGLLTIRRIADTFPLMDADIDIDRIFFAMNLDPRTISGELRALCIDHRNMFPARFYFEMKETFPLEMAAPARALMDEFGFGYALDDVDEADPAVRKAFEPGAAIVKLGYRRSKPLLDMHAARPREMLRELRSYEIPGKPLVVEALDEDVRQLFLYHAWKEEWGELFAQGRGLNAGPFYSRHLIALDSIGIAGGGYVLPAGAADPASSCPIGVPSRHECGHVRTPAEDLLLRWCGARPDTEDRIPERQPPVLAVLAPPAAGKTTLCRTFAGALLRLHGSNPASPAPALIDTAAAARKLRAMALAGNSPSPAQIIKTAAATAGLEDIDAYGILEAAREGRVTLIIDSLDHTTSSLPRQDAARILEAASTAAPQQTQARLLLTFRDSSFLDATDEQSMIPAGLESADPAAHWLPSPIISRLATVDPVDIPGYVAARARNSAKKQRRRILTLLEQWDAHGGNVDALPARGAEQDGAPARDYAKTTVWEQNAPSFSMLIHPGSLEYLTTLAATAAAGEDPGDVIGSLIGHLLRRDMPRSPVSPEAALVHMTRLAKHFAESGEYGMHTTRHYRWFQQNPSPALPPGAAYTPAQLESAEAALRSTALLTRIPSGHLHFISTAILKYLAAKAEQ